MPPCPVAASCSIVVTTPTAVSAAIHESLPAERDVMTATTLAHEDAPGSRLYARQIRAEAGTAHLRVQVRPSGQHDRIGWNAAETARSTSVVVTHHTAGSLVTLRLTAPPGFGPDIPALQRLAADQRLLALA